MPLIKNNISDIENLTLDNQHDIIINNINNEEKLIPLYSNNIKELNIKYNNMINSECTIEKKLEIIDEIKNLKNKIKMIKKRKKNYLLNNSKYVFDYFEKKKEITNIESNNKINLKFFFSNENNSLHLNKNMNIDKYFNNITNNINITNYCFDNNMCYNCNAGELIFIETDGLIICNNCHKTTKYYIENEKPNYREPPKEVCFYAYKRINHLREILAQFQAKETTLIPEEVIINIKLQIKKERIDLSELTNKKTKEILKNLKYNKYYEHIPYIKEKLGIKPPIMTPELEDKLCNLFTEIQPAYAKYCPKERVNFLNYYYTIYKLCELLEEHQFLPYFPMLKDREKRMEQDYIWKEICKELNWEFIPTI
jgi:hypothetical protein